jgi:hypothetical protein
LIKNFCAYLLAFNMHINNEKGSKTVKDVYNKAFIRGGNMIGKKAIFHIGLGILILSIAGLWACSSGGGSSGTSTSSGGSGANGTTGTLTINLTDSPFSDAKAVLVTFSEVQALHSSGGWITVPFAEGYTDRTCDLKKLVGSQNVLGTGPLPAGRHQQCLVF